MFFTHTLRGMLFVCRKKRGNPADAKRRLRSKSDKKISGFGYLSEGNLLCPCISKNNKPFIRVFDDVEKACRPIKDRSNEFKGYITMYFTDVPVYRDKDGSYDILDLEVEYQVWYKIVED